MGMGFQFVHLETFARKADSAGRSVSWVLDEAAREPGACPHVANPAPPEVVHGVALSDVRRFHDEACAGAQVTLANGRTRAVRKDQKTLLTIVASHPATMDAVRSEPTVAADVAAWERRTIDWLRGRYGDELLSVIRHTDESHAHLHAYVIPSDLRAAELHPGASAKRVISAAGPAEGEDTKALNRRADAAYKSAMRAWQDSYWETVGLPCGLSRLGPGRRRLSRAEWHEEKVAARSAKLALDRAAKLDQQGREFVAKVKAEASATIAAARARAASAKALHDAAVAEQAKAKSMLAFASREAKRLLAAARTEASRISSFGARLRSLVDGIRRSSVEAAARRAAAADIERERERAEDASRRLGEESRRRQEAERRAREAAAAVRTVAIQRDEARRELVALRPLPTAEETMGMRMRP